MNHSAPCALKWERCQPATAAMASSSGRVNEFHVELWLSWSNELPPVACEPPAQAWCPDLSSVPGHGVIKKARGKKIAERQDPDRIQASAHGYNNSRA